MSLHLGLHWGMILARMRNIFPQIKPSRVRTILLRIIAAAIAVYGLYVFVTRDLVTYMFLRTEFAFLDYGESPISFYIDYLAMMGLFIWIAYYLSRIFQSFDRRR